MLNAGSRSPITSLQYFADVVDEVRASPMPEKTLGLSQRKMAARFGVDPATLMGWEAGRHQPTGKSLDLIGRILQN